MGAGKGGERFTAQRLVGGAPVYVLDISWSRDRPPEEKSPANRA